LADDQLSTPHPQQLLEQAELIHSSEVIAAAISRLGDEISTTLEHENPIVLCVVSGGIVFAGQLLTRFAFPL
jgi:hypoxanthine phosphoribosyltransferase